MGKYVLLLPIHLHICTEVCVEVFRLFNLMKWSNCGVFFILFYLFMENFRKDV